MTRAGWTEAERQQASETSEHFGAAEQRRIGMLVAIKLGLGDTPWRLLLGSEKGARNPEETRRRLDIAAEKILARLEQGAWRER